MIVIESDFDHMNKMELSTRYPECRYLHVPPYEKNMSMARIRSHLVFGKRISSILDKTEPDLIWLQLPPNNTAKYCREYKNKHPEVKLILDIVDLWPESMPIGNFLKSVPAVRWRRWRDDCIRKADTVFLECNLYRRTLGAALSNVDAQSLYLYKDQADDEKKLVDQLISNRSVDQTEIKFAYLGSMNSILDIDGICRVLSRFVSSGKKCSLFAIGDGEFRERFESAVKDTGCETHFYGKIYDEKEKIRILSPCDYAFNMMKADVRVGLTIKSMDYLSYGLPLINNIKGDTWDMVKKHTLGINVDPNKEITIVSRFSHDSIRSFFDNTFTRQAFYAKLEDSLRWL